jgi:hypothetical protein
MVSQQRDRSSWSIKTQDKVVPYVTMSRGDDTVSVTEHGPYRLARVGGGLLWGHNIEPRIRQGPVPRMNRFIVDLKLIDKKQKRARYCPLVQWPRWNFSLGGLGVFAVTWTLSMTGTVFMTLRVGRLLGVSGEIISPKLDKWELTVEENMGTRVDRRMTRRADGRTTESRKFPAR